MEFEEQPIIYKCVETIYRPPKDIIYGEDIVQTTTQECGYGDIE